MRRNVRINSMAWGPFVTAVVLGVLDSVTANAVQSGAVPIIILPPRGHFVKEGYQIGLLCGASGSPTPTFRWEKDGKPFGPSENVFVHNETPHYSAIRIYPKMDMNRTTFTCVATNLLGQARAHARIFVHEGNSVVPSGYPVFTHHIRLRSIYTNINYTLKCEVKGNPKPVVTWLKDFLPVSINNDPRISFGESGELFIENTRESDQGDYGCMAENKWGVAYTNRAMIYVDYRRTPPKISKVSDDQSVFPGSDVNLTCLVLGTPTPRVTWMDDHQTVLEDSGILVLTNVLQSTNLTCEASNDFGTVSKTVLVIVVGFDGTTFNPKQETKISSEATSAINVSGREVFFISLCIVVWVHGPSF